MEYLSKTLYHLLRDTGFKGLSLEHVRAFGWQSLMALCLLSHPQLQIVHCDLKPENIMLKDENRSGIKFVDFGSSCVNGEQFYKYVQSRYYRAPEVLLELDYGHPIDIWSLGCILAELHLGKPLFNGYNETDQVRKIVQLRGMPPVPMLLRSRKAHKFFVFNGFNTRLKQPEDSAKGADNFAELFNIHAGGPHGEWVQHAQHTVRNYQNFIALLERMLEYDPKRRITPQEALVHQFFQDGNTDGNYKFKVPAMKRLLPGTPTCSTPRAFIQETRRTPVPWPSQQFPCMPPLRIDRYNSQVYKRSPCAMVLVSPFSKQSTEVSATNSVIHSPQLQLYRPSSLDAQDAPAGDPCKNTTPR